VEKQKKTRLEQTADDIAELITVNKGIALDRSPNSILPDESIYQEKSDIFLKKLYDFLAQQFGYQTIDHMVNVAQVLLVANTIANPKGPTQGAIRAMEQIKENIRPKGDHTQGKLVKGDTKGEILKSFEEFYKPKAIKAEEELPS